jgi:mRNA-degrading endonuclease toxin of MazEF toxin-antitoxin module
VIRQGEIYTIDGSPLRVVVLSNDVVSNRGLPIVAPIARGSYDAPPYAVALDDLDSVAGVVFVNRMYAILPDRLNNRSGMVSGATWRRLHEALTGTFADLG